MSSYIAAVQSNVQRIVTEVAASEKCSVRFGLVSYRDHPPQVECYDTIFMYPVWSLCIRLFCQICSHRRYLALALFDRHTFVPPNHNSDEQDSSYITKIFPFTEDLDAMRANVNTMVRATNITLSLFQPFWSRFSVVHSRTQQHCAYHMLAIHCTAPQQSASGGGDGPEAVCCGLHKALHFEWRPNAAKVVILIADAPPHGLGEHGDGFPNGCPDGVDPMATARSMLEAGRPYS
jgi:hypothetical protein